MGVAEDEVPFAEIFEHENEHEHAHENEHEKSH
jgi:hypothetical protein